MTHDQQRELKTRLDQVENPDWYLEILGAAYEETNDLDIAMRVADRMVGEEPHPPETEEDREMQAVTDVLAIVDYAETMEIDPAPDAVVML